MRGIYEGRNIFTDTVYYGQSVNMPIRIKRHIYDLRNNKHDNDYLQAAWNKYGESAFVFKPVQIVKDVAIDLTPIETKYYYSTDNKYNLQDPERVLPVSEETRRKISEAGKNRIISKETCKKISIAKTGKSRPDMKNNKFSLGVYPSKETKKKISIAMSGSSNPFYGKKHSSETIQIIIEKGKGNKNASGKRTEEFSKRMSGINSPMFGKHHTEEWKQQTSERMKRIWSDRKAAKEPK